MFRVVGYDQYDHSDYVVKDVISSEEAIRIAKANAGVPNAIPTSFCDQYFVYDDCGTLLLHVEYDDIPKTVASDDT